MTNTITHQNIDHVLDEVINKLNEADWLLSNPGCSSESVSSLRNNALNAVRNAYYEVMDVAHQTYLVK